jgi:putative membrane protein
MTDQPQRAGGDEPDPRFLLAAERTFLAWVRTGLALLAAGLGVLLLPPSAVTALPRILSAALLLVGFAVSATAYPRWRHVETAMRTRTPLPSSGAAWFISYTVAVAALLGLVLVLMTDG